MFGFLLSHEIDAALRHEWRLLPLIRRLPDKTGERVFIWAHVPLFFGVAVIVSAGESSIAAQALSGFAIAHVGLHWLFRNHPANEFGTYGSQALIWGAGAFGAAHLAASYPG